MQPNDVLPNYYRRQAMQCALSITKSVDGGDLQNADSSASSMLARILRLCSCRRQLTFTFDFWRCACQSFERLSFSTRYIMDELEMRTCSTSTTNSSAWSTNTISSSSDADLNSATCTRAAGSCWQDFRYIAGSLDMSRCSSRGLTI